MPGTILDLDITARIRPGPSQKQNTRRQGQESRKVIKKTANFKTCIGISDDTEA